MTSVSLRPQDVSDYANRLLQHLPELRGQLSAAMGAAGQAAAASSAAAATALRDSGTELHRAVGGLDTSLERLAAALHTAADDLIAQDAALWGQRPAAPAAAPQIGGGA